MKRGFGFVWLRESWFAPLHDREWRRGARGEMKMREHGAAIDRFLTLYSRSFTTKRITIEKGNSEEQLPVLNLCRDLQDVNSEGSE